MDINPAIRFGKIEDLPAIVDIYNHAIRSGGCTGDLDEFKVQDRINWFEKFNSNNSPIYVITVGNDIAGYGTLSPYRQGRKAMRNIAEISFFLDEKFQGKGLGSKLVDHIIQDCRRLRKKTLLAVILDVNKKSIGILKKFGFEQWGYFPKVIELKDKTCGQLIYGLKLDNSDQ